MTSPTPPAVEADRLTLREGGSVVLNRVAFTVPRGSISAFLGSEDSLHALMLVLAGKRRPDEGRVRILGRDARSFWRLRGRRRVVDLRRGEDLLSKLGRRRAPELLLLESPRHDAANGLPARLREFASRGTAILLTTDDAGLAGAAADRIGVLARGRLAAEGPIRELLARFRRIRYSNRRTETRTEFGNELDAFEAVSVRVRGWGVDAVVANFDEAAFDRFRGMDGVEDAGAETLTLEEIRRALVESVG